MEVKKGRKPKYKEPMTQNILIRITPEQHTRLSEHSATVGESVSDIIRDSINKRILDFELNKKRGTNEKE